MANFLKKYINDKKTWKSMEKRAHALPDEYDFVYHKIQNYMWNFAAGHDSGVSMIAIFEDLLTLFEEGTANGKNVLEVTGEDVAAFCDELLRNARTYTENWREALNRDIMIKLGRMNNAGKGKKHGNGN